VWELFLKEQNNLKTTAEILKNAKALKSFAFGLSTQKKDTALEKMAEELVKATEEIIEANKLDIKASRGIISDVMIDRLSLSPQRIMAMAKGILDVRALPDPVGRVLESHKREDGLEINKVSVPFGVVAIIYESRPNVTSDAAALSFKSGNICVLRGGKEAYRTSRAIVNAMRKALKKLDIPEDMIQLIEDTTRTSATELMTAVGFVDLLIPRGGKGLIKACLENAKVPCIETGTGICHIYIEKTADQEMALNILENAKTSRPSVCNAAEVCLIDREIAKDILPLIKKRLVDKRVQEGNEAVELRLCKEAQKLISGTPAKENDFDTEFLDYILGIKIVPDVKVAVEHIALHSTGHSEAIITGDVAAEEYFIKHVDSAAVYVNSSTRFTDGGEFGLGCEMGISTQKLHARGPMGLSELNVYKYVIKGNGHIR